MKLRIALSVALLSVSLAAAENLTLKDGRTLYDAVVVADEPTQVVVRHRNGLISVPKALLPPEVAAKHPVDLARAAKENDAQQKRRELAELEQKRRATQAKNTAANVAPDETEETLADVKMKALDRAKSYFEANPNEGYDPAKTKISVDYLRREPDSDNRWYVRGSLVTVTYERTGGPSYGQPSSNALPPSRFDKGATPTPAPAGNLRDVKRVEDRKDFEAYLTLDAVPYTIDVRML